MSDDWRRTWRGIREQALACDQAMRERVRDMADRIPRSLPNVRRAFLDAMGKQWMLGEQSSCTFPLSLSFKLRVEAEEGRKLFRDGRDIITREWAPVASVRFEEFESETHREWRISLTLRDGEAPRE